MRQQNCGPAERFKRTLKTEQIDGTRYRDLQHARADIAAFIEQVYDSQRLHTALAYRSPIQFEELHRAELAAGAARGGPPREFPSTVRGPSRFVRLARTT